MEKPNTQITSVQEFAHERLLDNLLIDRELCKNKSDQLQLVSNAALALNPWPNLWTEIVTSHGQQRMKILSCHVSDQQLILDQVQIEGKNPCLFRECKNALL
jgi:methionyl-tRNA formyltransferase